MSRPPVTTATAIERVALDLFAERGFAETTVDDIAGAAGISRRTFFRYYDSKNDVVWGDFTGLLQRMEGLLKSSSADEPLVDAIAAAVVATNILPARAVRAHRARMWLITKVPALQAHSALRYADWRDVIARFAAERLGLAVESLGPRLVGHVALGAAAAAYDQWLADDEADLGALLRAAFDAIDLGVTPPG